MTKYHSPTPPGGSFPRATRWALSLVLACVSLGCGFSSQAQIARSEAEKLQLLHRLEQEQHRAAAAEASRRELEARLAEAEKDAARLASRTTPSSPGRDASASSSSAAGWQQRSIATALRSLAERHGGLTPVENGDLGTLDTSILFDPGRAELKPDAAAALDEQIKLLQAATGAGLRVLVAGHADSQSEAGAAPPGAPSSPGAAASAAAGQLEISAARASAVAAYLRRKGIDEAHIATVALGARQPLVDSSTPAGQTRNRRAEIYLVGPQTPLLGANWRAPATR